MTRWFVPTRRELLPQGHRPGSLPWMIAATCFLAVIAVAAALALATSANRMVEAGLDRFTIELVDPDSRRLEADAGHLLRRLAADPAVATSARVPPQEIAALLAPSLGPALAGLPLPALIDVTLRRGASDRSLLLLAGAMRGSRLIRAADGLAPLAKLVETLRRLAWAIVAIAAVVTILIAILAARVALEAHGPTLATLHALGATDRDLATLVQRRTARDALMGGLAGLVSGAITIWIVGNRIAAMGAVGGAAGVAAGGASLLGLGDWVVLLAVPIALSAAATLATRLAVLSTLRRAP